MAKLRLKLGIIVFIFHCNHALAAAEGPPESGFTGIPAPAGTCGGVAATLPHPTSRSPRPNCKGPPEMARPWKKEAECAAF